MVGTPKLETSGRRTIWQELEVWGERLQRWQRYALSQAVTGGRLTPEAVDATYGLLLADNGLGPEPAVAVEIPKSLTGRPHGSTSPLRLVRLQRLNDVNALPADAQLTFGSALTVVYGKNASGKSGFFRVLAAMCFSRSARTAVLPNVYRAGVLAATPRAEIVVADDTAEKAPIVFSQPSVESELRRISVFDASIARIHVESENEFSFRPAGFDVFPEMVRVYNELGGRLEKEAAAKAATNPFPDLLAGKDKAETPVFKALSSLSAGTDSETLRRLGVFGDADRAEFADLSQKLNALRATSVDHIRAQAEEQRADVVALRTAILEAIAHFTSEKLAEYAETLRSYQAQATVAASEGVEALKVEGLASIGSARWHAFIAAAQELAKEEGEDYPTPGEPCLLCHRSVDESAHAVIHATWRYLRGEARRRADGLRGRLRATALTLRSLAFDFYKPETRVRPYLERTVPETARHVADLVQSLGDRRDQAERVLDEGGGDLPEPIVDAVTAKLQEIADGLDAEITRLRAQTQEEAIRTLTSRYTELRHREILAQNLDRVLQHVEELRWEQKAADVCRRVLNTKPVTDKETQLSKELIGKEYRETLAAECAALGCAVPMLPQMRGSRGRTVRSLALTVNHRPADVLSEGEQRAVALADFLTEVRLNHASAGIVFDDPVTSFDSERKERIAKRLAEEARSRQVIVFTHDMEFLVQICDEAKAREVAHDTHWVHTDGSRQPGVVSANDGPLSSKTYRDAEYARAQLGEARSSAGSARVEALRRGFGAVRTCLEFLVLRNVLKDVVSPYRRQVRMTKLAEITYDHSLLRDIQAAFEEISSYIDAHFRPDGTAGSDPATDDLERFITRYEELRKRAK